jgi:hypothetical protein
MKIALLGFFAFSLYAQEPNTTELVDAVAATAEEELGIEIVDEIPANATLAPITAENSDRLLKLFLLAHRAQVRKIENSQSINGEKKEELLAALKVAKQTVLSSYDAAEEKGYLIGSIFFGVGGLETKIIPIMPWKTVSSHANVQYLMPRAWFMFQDSSEDRKLYFHSSGMQIFSLSHFVSGKKEHSLAQLPIVYAGVYVQLEGTELKFMGDIQKYHLGGSVEFPIDLLGDRLDLSFQVNVLGSWNDYTGIVTGGRVLPSSMMIFVSVDGGKAPFGVNFPQVTHPILLGAFESDGVSRTKLSVPGVQWDSEKGYIQNPFTWNNLFDYFDSTLTKKEEAKALILETLEQSMNGLGIMDEKMQQELDKAKSE